MLLNIKIFLLLFYPKLKALIISSSFWGHFFTGVFFHTVSFFVHHCKNRISILVKYFRLNFLFNLKDSFSITNKFDIGQGLFDGKLLFLIRSIHVFVSMVYSRLGLIESALIPIFLHSNIK